MKLQHIMVGIFSANGKEINSKTHIRNLKILEITDINTKKISYHAPFNLAFTVVPRLLFTPMYMWSL